MIKRMTALVLVLSVALFPVLVGCTAEKTRTAEPLGPTESTVSKSSPTEPTVSPSVGPTKESPDNSPDKGEKMSYQTITQQQAKEIMDSEQPHVILDVREENEFAQGHIPGAILLPHEKIQQLAPTLRPDKNALILVYCRRGRRSKIAAEALADMGYSNVKEFGGILDWKYEIVT
ncbi:MAG: rhodanese-like domain-containing protein [Clostridia bacterium]|nr:rhodanese-like domain-containing protein [Clostridia bacterium]